MVIGLWHSQQKPLCCFGILLLISHPVQQILISVWPLLFVTGTEKMGEENVHKLPPENETQSVDQNPEPQRLFLSRTDHRA